MDECARLIAAYRAGRRRASAPGKLDLLMDLGRLDDLRVVPFFRAVLLDGAEPREVRIDVLKRLGDATLTPGERVTVAASIMQLLGKRSDAELRLRAALVLEQFADLPEVTAALGGLAADPDEPAELRYTAFTSVQRAGPTPESIQLLRRLSGDELLGPVARSVLGLWGHSR